MTTRPIQSTDGPSPISGPADTREIQHPAEEALHRSEARYRALAEAVGHVGWFWDPSTRAGQFESTQRWWEEVTGQTPEQQQGEGWLERVHPDDRERARSAWTASMATGKPYQIEYRVVARSGDLRSVLSRAVALRGTDGEIREWVGSLTDVTEQRRAEAAVRASEERYRSLFESTSDAVLIGAADGTYVDANLAAAEMLGTPLERLIGSHYSEFIDPAWKGIGEEVRRSIQETGRWEGEFPMRRADGTIVWADYRSRFDGEHILGVARDITERRLAEQVLRESAETLREAGRRKDEFLAMLAHELRNPLAPIRNAVEVLRRIGPAEPRLLQVREMIERQVAHMAHLIDDLLDVSRISRGKILLRGERIDLTAVVRAAVEDHRNILEGNGLRLEMELPDGPLWLSGDPIRLSQIVGNLLQNSEKFTNSGGWVRVHLASDPAAGEAVLTVEDSGIGMEPDILARLFEPFSQADGSLDRSRGGLGLGLALVKGLVELHGGDVRAASAGRGSGSAFTIHLPLPETEPAVAGIDAVVPAVARPLRILVVEDNRDAADSLRMLLELAGYPVEVAYTGWDGLEIACRFHPQVALCDIGLPGGMDGYALARALRGDEETAGAHLIAISGYGQEEDQRLAREAGFDRHLTKPVEPAALMRLLEELAARP
jgi:PAS domain S-box-containing protein